MKAEPERHHHEHEQSLTPLTVEERPETAVARKVEELGEHPPRLIGAPTPAPPTPAPGGTAPRTPAPRASAAPVVPGADVAPGGADGAKPEDAADEPDRKPASVGKPRAQGEDDHLR
jgi:hypothetical protein